MRHFQIKPLILGVLLPFLFYGASRFVVTHLQSLRYPYILTSVIIVLFFILGVLGVFLLRSVFKGLHSPKVARIWESIGLSIILLLSLLIWKIPFFKKVSEVFLYRIEYFVQAAPVIRVAFTDLILLFILLAIPSFLLGSIVLFEIRLFTKNRTSIPLFLMGATIACLAIIIFLPRHTYQVSQDLPRIYLKRDGRVIADNALSYLATERLKVSLPVVMVGPPEKILFIGLGTGTALATAEGIRSIESIICVEPERGILNAACRFLPLKRDDFKKDKRLEIIRQRADKYLLSQKKKYDLVIVNDARFSTRRNLRLLRDFLNKGGLVVSTVSLDSGNIKKLKDELAIYRSLFSNSSVWMAHSSLSKRLLVLSSDERKRFDFFSARKRFLNAGVSPMLISVNINNTFDLFNTLIFSQSGLNSYLNRNKDLGLQGECSPFLERFFLPSKEERVRFWRNNIIDIVKNRTSPLEILSGPGYDNNVKERINRYFNASIHTIFGQIYKEINGSFGLGELEFRRALGINPFDADAAYAVGAFDRLANIMVNAHPECSKATGEIIKGGLLLEKGEFGAALDKLTRALSQEPANELGHLYLGHYYRTVGNFDKALAEYKTIIAVNPHFSIPPLQPAITRDISTHRAFQMAVRGTYYWEHNRRQEFLSTVKEILRLNYEIEKLFPPEIMDSPIFKKNIERIKESLGPPSRAEVVQEILEGLHTMLGHNYWLTARYEEAAGQFELALSLARRGEHLENLYSNLGNCFAEMGDVKKARRYYDKALEINPNISHINRYIRSDTLETEVSKNPDDAHLLNKLGLAYKDIFDYGKAINCFEKALKVDPEFQEAVFNYQETVFQRVLSLNPDDFYILNALGVFYWDSEKPEKAISSFMRALKITPAYAPAHFNLAMAYQAAGMNKEATDHYRKALKLNPEMKEAKKRLEKIILKGRN